MKTSHKIYYDTEFVEGFTKPLFGKSEHFIDLISIGMVREDGSEYYAINKEVDLKRAWYAHTLKPNKQFPMGPINYKEYWVRDNVLKPIFHSYYKPVFVNLFGEPAFTLKNMQTAINGLGKTKKEINGDIRNFVYGMSLEYDDCLDGLDYCLDQWLTQNTIEFLGYYSAYDHVLLASLFGRMVDWPKGFPMYTTDVQQKKAAVEKLIGERRLYEHVGGGFLLEKLDSHDGKPMLTMRCRAGATTNFSPHGVVSGLEGCRDYGYVPGPNDKAHTISEHRSYPKETNAHHALADAKWTKALDEFLSV